MILTDSFKQQAFVSILLSKDYKRTTTKVYSRTEQRQQNEKLNELKRNNDEN